MPIMLLSEIGKQKQKPSPAAKRLLSRPSPRQRGYSSQWDAYSKEYRRQHPVCEWKDEPCSEPTQCVDHTIPHSGPDDPLFWDPTNHQGLCWSHHSVKTCKRDGGYGHRRKRK